MTTTTTAVTSPALPPTFAEDAFEAFLASRSEPDWLTARRREAFASFQQKFAVPLDPEEWKRVDTRAFRPGGYRIQPTGSQPVELQTLMQERAAFAGRVSHVDGQVVEGTLDESLRKQGVIFGSLSEALQTHGSILEKYLLTDAVRPQTDRFSAWHAAFFGGGAVLYVPRGVNVAAPLHSLIALATDGAADLSHTLVILEENASATLLEETASTTAEASGLHVGAVELWLAPGANLRYVQLQNWNDRVYHFAHQAGRVDSNASLQWTLGGLGSKLTHIHQDVRLVGRAANAQVNGVSFSTDRQLLSYYTQQWHEAEDTHSDLLYKQVLTDKSRGVWRGMIRVEPEAQRTDGYQRNDTLLLTPTARADAIPGLEIEADDVRCTHGATVGRVDLEQIFYCMCRGLTEQEAMHIIVEGFFQTVFDRIPVELVRETLNEAVAKKLGIGD